MSYTRGKKLSRKAKAIKSALALVEGLDKLEKAGALHINRETRECHLVKELFWTNKSLAWKNNFIRNVAFMMDKHLDKPLDKQIDFYAIDVEKKERGEYLVSYWPKTGMIAKK